MTVGLASSDGRPTPYLRWSEPGEVDGSVPDGWVAEAVGTWQRVQAEVVYDSRRHDVMICDGLGHGDTAAALYAAGWIRCAVEGRKSLWARDRVMAAQQALTRSEAAAVASTGHTGVEHAHQRSAPGRGISL